MQAVKNDIVKDRIASLDLQPIMFKLVTENGYTTDQVQVLEKWYKRFLFLTFKYKEQPIVIAEAIDTFWHQHILDTRKYAEDCAAVFGDFLHHFPYFGLRGEDDRRALRTAYQATLNLLREEYGETPEDDLKVFWNTGVPAVDVASMCSDCSGNWRNGNSLYNEQRPRLL